MLVDINSKLETVLNPNGRFRTLNGIYSVTSPDGRLITTSNSISVNFEMVYNEEHYIMKCLKTKGLGIKSQLKEISLFCSLVNSPHITRYDYKESEMLVYNEVGKPIYLDVIMQKIPDGTPLIKLLELYVKSGDAIKVSRFIEGFAPLALWMLDNNFSHGRISVKNMYLGDDGSVTLINYERSYRERPYDDIRCLGVLCSAIYLTACDERFFQHWEHETGSYTSTLQAMKDIAAEGCPDELRELLEAIDSHFDSDEKANEICKLMKDLSSCKPARINSLTKMLDSLAVSDINGTPALHAGNKYAYVGEPNDNLIRVFNGKKWSYLDKAGNIAIDGEFTDAEDFQEGRAIVETLTGFGVIDKEGKFLVKPIFDDMDIDSSASFIIATKDGYSGIFDRDGNTVTGLVYEQILSSSDGMIPVKKDKKFGFLNKNGVVAIPIIYDDVHQFKNGVANVKLKGRKYVIDRKGEIIGEATTVTNK